MQNGGKGYPSVIQFICNELVEMFVSLEPHGIFLSHFAYICMSTFPNYWLQNHLSILHILLIYFNIVLPLVCKTVARVCQASFWPVEVF